MAYTHKQTAAFVTTWQTSSTVAEVVCRLQEHPEFPNHLGDKYDERGIRKFSTAWANIRRKALQCEGVPLKDLPKTNKQRRESAPDTPIAPKSKENQCFFNDLQMSVKAHSRLPMTS